MEESAPVVIVTRMRLRRSVDTDESKSPSTPSTPTKKRGRLAAKPQLDLIDENVQENVPRRATRKSIVKEIEPTEEKVLTPSRRSTRIRSNTSIVSETTQNIDSPRAKRAARRNSQVGSDTETPITPVRQTRRTRRDSASSIDKINDTITATKIDETIYEELDTNNVQEDTTKKVVSKSPRLRGKNKTTNQTSNDTNENTHSDKVTSSKDNITEEKSPVKSQSTVDEKLVSSEKNTIKLSNKSLTSQENDDLSPRDVSNDEKENLSVSSSNLLKIMNTDPKKVRDFFNRSTPNLIECSAFKSKRHRTKSLTPNTGGFDNEAYFLSDNESAKKKVRNKVIDLKTYRSSGDESKTFQDGSTKRKHDEIKLNLSDSNEISDFNVPGETNTYNINVQEKKVTDTANKEEFNQHNTEVTTTTLLLQKEPSEFQMSLVFDSDTNSSTDKKDTTRQKLGSEDQCVPIMDTKANNSYEPMDIDETIPGNITMHILENDSSSELIINDNNKSTQLSSESVNEEIIKNNKNSLNVSHEKDITKLDGLEKSGYSKTTSLDESEQDNKEGSKRNNRRKSSMSTLSESQNTRDLKVNSSISMMCEDSSDAKELKLNKLARKSVVSISTDNSLNKSKRESSGQLEADNYQYKLSTSCAIEELKGRKSSVSETKLSADNLLEIDSIAEDPENTSRKSSVNITSEDLDNSNKSKRKSSISKNSTQIFSQNTSSIDSENNIDNYSKSKIVNESFDVTHIDKSYNNSKRKKSISQIETITNHENSNNENKSTLILSQIKDTSHETNKLSKTPSKHKKNLMSKSMDTPSEVNENNHDKKNISINCLSTSTPLHEKPLKKRGMPINTPDFGLKDKKKADRTKDTNNKNQSLLKDSDKSSDNQGSDSETGTSTDESNMIDDECEEANDDYESGDSRDDEERAYEENNEIVEKGETLDSDEDFSNDSDYDKDSFIVSSDEEDNELLSGSGDDLSMSDNELTMSNKSKMKYNNRKNKEQKKASKEMYEARHEWDKAKQKSKSNRQRIDSSVITTDEDPEEEASAKPKKNKRMRIDSSHDANNMDSVLNTSNNKKKNIWRFSESICDDNALNEKEMTICEPIESENDPLLVQVKPEPKTPQYNSDISTINLTRRQDVEELHLNENMSMFKPNETRDPLQATVMSENDDSSSVSENEEITKNYEYMLHNLNDVKPNKIKSLDISLNINKKTKKNIKDPIFDELNLTQVDPKKNKKDLKESAKPPDSNINNVFNKPKSNNPVASDTESSSNSIDMKLLFPEESNDSEANSDTFKTNEKMSETVQDFIPLKKSEGATNISLNKDNTNNSVLNDSKKKKNKNRNSSEQSAAETVHDTKDIFAYFVDTEGMQEDSSIAVKTSNSSTKKNKQKKHANNIMDIDDEPVETLYTNENTGKKAKISLSAEKNNTDNGDSSNEAPLEISFVKKKDKTNTDQIEEVNITNIINNVPNNMESQNPKKKKKKSKHSDISDIQEVITETGAAGDNVIEITKHVTNKKTVHGKDSQNIECGIIEQSNVDDIVVLKTTKNKKKKDIMDNVDDVGQTVLTEEYTKKKKSNKASIECVLDSEKQEQVTDDTRKRKRKSSANTSLEIGAIQEAVEPSKEFDVSMKGGNKKKKRKMDHTNEDIVENIAICHEKTEKIERKKLKKNKKLKLDIESIPQLQTETVEIYKNKKRKNDNDDTAHKVKVLKQNSNDKIHVPRLSETVLSQLTDKLKPEVEKKKLAISTTPFSVEEITKRTTKPSNYLEESVYINKSPKPKKKKYPFKNVRVLPFMPTATTSYTGFTTAFNVKVLEENTQTVAQTVSNFKNDYLLNKRIKKLGTLEKYKRSINTKISKF